MARTLILALASSAALLTAGAAHAGSVTWSIGVNAPGATTVVSNAPAHRGAPAYASAPVYRPAPAYAPAPVVYLPPPAVVGRPRLAHPVPNVAYRPVPRYAAHPPAVWVRPAPVVYERVPPWAPGQRHDGRYDARRDPHAGRIDNAGRLY